MISNFDDWCIKGTDSPDILKFFIKSNCIIFEPFADNENVQCSKNVKSGTVHLNVEWEKMDLGKLRKLDCTSSNSVSSPCKLPSCVQYVD